MWLKRKEILAQIRCQGGEERRGEERRLSDRERWRECRGGLGGRWLTSSAFPQHEWRTQQNIHLLTSYWTSAELRPPSLRSSLTFSLSFSLCFYLSPSISHPLPAAPMDNRIILLSCTGSPDVHACLRCGVRGLCSSLLEVTPENKSWLKCAYCKQTNKHVRKHADLPTLLRTFHASTHGYTIVFGQQKVSFDVVLPVADLEAKHHSPS